MYKITKVHKAILLFIIIFLIGIYTLTLYINHTIDQKKELTPSQFNTSISTEQPISPN